MKILKITGFVNPDKNGIKIKELEVRETLKSYIVEGSLRSVISKNEIKKIKTIFKNTIDPNSRINSLSFYTYCLDNESDKKEVIREIKLEINSLISLANEKILQLIENRFKDIND